MSLLKHLGRMGLLGVMVLASLGLIAYLPGWRLLGSFRPEFIPMAPSTAVSFLICAGGLLLDDRLRSQRPALVAMSVLLAITALFGLLEVVGFAVQRDLNFEDVLVPDFGRLGGIPLARMSPSTGAFFFVAASAMLLRFAGLFRPGHRLWRHGAGVMGALTMVGGLTFLLGYLYGTPLMYHARTVPMALTTALGFLLLGMGLMVAVGPEYFPGNRFAGVSTRARLMRAFFPLCIGAMLAQGILSRLSLFVFGINDALASAVLLIVFSGLTAAVVLQVSRVIGNQIDRSEAQRRQAEEALAMEKEQLAVTLRSIGDGVITTDTQGRITLINGVAEALTGWPQAAAVGRPLEEVFRIISEKTRKPCPHPVKEVLQGNGILGLGNGTLLIARNGTERVIADSGSPIRDSRGKTVGVVLVFRDITADMEIEAELRQAHKMEAIGTLAGGIAHEFNNVLGIIMGYAELAAGELPDHTPVRDSLDQIRQACHRARDVVRQLLNFSRKGAAERTRLDMIPVVKETIKMLRASTPSTVDLRGNIPDEVDTVLADPTQIHQLLFNLCTNATHAMGDGGGMLTIALRNTMVDDPVAMGVPDIRRGAYVELAVSDTGHGIDPAVRERIFDPYFTTKGVGKGTGMGLAVVHGIVKGHEGAIGVESKMGAGTTFRVYFPVVHGPALDEAQAAPEALPVGHERILFVDDEPALVKTGQATLGRLGYRVVGETHPAAALDRIRSAPDDFDLVITDMTMPEIPGDKLAGAILAIRPDLPVVISSGFSERLDKDSAAAMGIRAYIEKPLSAGEIARVVREVLDAEKKASDAPHALLDSAERVSA